MGIVAVGRAATFVFVRPSPRTRASPVPRNVRARPDTTWSARRWIVTIAWRSARRPPTSIAAMTPIHGLPVDRVVEKPATAPMSIIPSTPRFRTPARSAKISPIAANRNTVPVATPAARMRIGSISSRATRGGHIAARPAHAPLDPHAIPDDDLREDQAEQDDPLDHRRDARRLDLAPGEDQRAEQDRRDDHPERPEPGEVGDDDRGVAIARRDAVLQPVHDP